MEKVLKGCEESVGKIVDKVRRRCEKDVDLLLISALVEPGGQYYLYTAGLSGSRKG